MALSFSNSQCKSCAVSISSTKTFKKTSPQDGGKAWEQTRIDPDNPRGLEDIAGG